MRLVAWTPAALVTALSLGTAIDQLAEAYGAGAPYYDRTVNMDKWSSPWPAVLLLTAACVGAIALTAFAVRSTDAMLVRRSAQTRPQFRR